MDKTRLGRSDPSLRAMLEAVEHERADLAARLHDGPLQSIVAASMNARLLADEAQGTDAEILERVTDAADAAVQELRSLIRRLDRPTMSAGLGSALESLMSHDLGDKASVIDRLAHDPHPEVAAAAYRLAQGLVEAAIAGSAETLQVTLTGEGGAVLVDVLASGVADPLIADEERFAGVVEGLGGWWKSMSDGRHIQFFLAAAG